MPIDDDFETPTDETSLMLVREISGFVRAGELDRAEAVIRERLDEQPRFAFGQLLLGIIFAHGKRFDEALEACEAALAINPRLAPARLQIGRIHYDQDDHAKAREHVDAALAMDPNLAGGQLMLGLLAIEANDLDAAETALKDTLDIRPRHIAARLILADLYLDDGRIRKAIRLLKAVVKDRPESLIARQRLGRTLAAAGKLKDAVKVFEAAADHAPRPARFHALAGDVYRLLDRPTEAETAYEKALSLQPRFERARYGLSDTLIDQARYQDALAALDDVLQRRIRNHAVHQRHGLILFGMGRNRDALNAFQAALRFDDSLIRRDPGLAALLDRGDDAALRETASRVRALLKPLFSLPDRETRIRQRDFAMHFRQMMPRAHPLAANESSVQESA